MMKMKKVGFSQWCRSATFTDEERGVQHSPVRRDDL